MDQIWADLIGIPTINEAIIQLAIIKEKKKCAVNYSAYSVSMGMPGAEAVSQTPSKLIANNGTRCRSSKPDTV